MKSVTIKCNTCEEQITINADEFDFENIATEPRQMGAEKTYEGTVERVCKNQLIEVTHRFWEYPEGTENDSETEVSGGTIVKNTL